MTQELREALDKAYRALMDAYNEAETDSQREEISTAMDIISNIN